MQKQFISFQQMQGLVASICRDITHSNWKPDLVVGITRGGCLPAVMISHYFNTPAEMLTVSLRDGGETTSNCWLAEEAFGYNCEKKNILVVDDICDNGNTFDWIVNDWQQSCCPVSDKWKNIWNHNVRFAAIVDNVANNFSKSVDYAGMEINKAEMPVWIEFPYESWWNS